VPPGFGVWLLYLLIVIGSLVALGYNPSGTLPGTIGGRLPAVALRLSEYIGLTIILIYVGNLTDKELPQRKLVKLLAWSFVITVAGGLLGTFFPKFEFTSPVEILLPGSFGGNSFVRSLTHPYAAQNMHVFGVGSDTPRAAAPWSYTNTWGNNYSILVGWFLIFGWVWAKKLWHRVVTVGILLISAIPVIGSLNRGLWLSLGAMALYVGVRMAMRGRLWTIVAMMLGATVVAVVMLFTSVGGLIMNRLEHGHSNDIRIYTTKEVLEGVRESPWIGFGSTRSTQGSDQSIAVGASPACPSCGNHDLGSNGQVWLELYTHGIIGVTLFLMFFVVALWKYRHDRSAVGIVTSTVLLISLLASFYYNTLVTPLAFIFLSYATLWRRHQFLDERARKRRAAGLDDDTEEEPKPALEW
jgi:O-antigen ligase